MILEQVRDRVLHFFVQLANGRLPNPESEQSPGGPWKWKKMLKANEEPRRLFVTERVVGAGPVSAASHATTPGQNRDLTFHNKFISNQ